MARQIGFLLIHIGEWLAQPELSSSLVRRRVRESPLQEGRDVGSRIVRLGPKRCQKVNVLARQRRFALDRLLVQPTARAQLDPPPDPSVTLA